MKISAAGNTEVPAILALEDKGFEVSCKENNSLFTTSKLGITYTANSPLELLGLIEMHSLRGNSWKATDTDIERCIKQYNGLA